MAGNKSEEYTIAVENSVHELYEIEWRLEKLSQDAEARGLDRSLLDRAYANLQVQKHKWDEGPKS